MKSLKVTPLILVAALIMSWIALQLFEGQWVGSRIGLLMLLLVSVWVADQVFRIFLKSMKQIWLIEGLFVLLVALIIWIIRAS
jgi:hypothetical protein